MVLFDITCSQGNIPSTCLDARHWVLAEIFGFMLRTRSISSGEHSFSEVCLPRRFVTSVSHVEVRFLDIWNLNGERTISVQLIHEGCRIGVLVRLGVRINFVLVILVFWGFCGHTVLVAVGSVVSTIAKWLAGKTIPWRPASDLLRATV